MEKKPQVTAEKLAAFKDGKLPEDEKEKILVEISKDPELFEELCLLEELRLAQQAGLKDAPDENRQKALTVFQGSIGSKLALFLAGKAVPIAAGIMSAAAIVVLAIFFVSRQPGKTAQPQQPKPAASKPSLKKSEKKSGRTSSRFSRKNSSNRSTRRGSTRKSAGPGKKDPYARFKYKVPRKSWNATRKLLDKEPKDLLAAFEKDSTPKEETVYALAIKGKDLIPKIKELAGSGSDQHRGDSFKVLELMAVFGHIDKKEKTELVTFLTDRISNDTVREVKKDAIKLLESLKLDKKTTFETLKGGLDDTDANFRAEIIKKLAKYVTPESVPEIVDRLSSDSAPEVQVAVIESTRFINPKPNHLLEGILNAMQSAADPRVKFAALKFLKANRPKNEDRELKKEFQGKVLTTLTAVVEADAEGTPVKPGRKAARYTKSDVMPDVETRIEALDMLISAAGKKNRVSATESIARLARSSSRPALKTAAMLKLDRLDKGRAFEMILETVKNSPIEDQKTNPAYILFCRKLDSISRQSFGLKPGQAEGDYIRAVEKAENWFAEHKEDLVPKQEDEDGQ